MYARRAFMVLICLQFASIQTGLGNQLSVYTNFVDSIKTVAEEETKTVDFNYTLVDPVQGNESLLLTVCVFVEDPNIATTYLGDKKLFNLQREPTGQFNIFLKGLFIGRTYTHVRFVFSRYSRPSPCKTESTEDITYHSGNQFNITNIFPGSEQTLASSEGRFEVVVIREDGPIDIAFNVVVVLLVVIVNLGLGCKTEIAVIKATYRRPVAPITGFCTQFIIMPLITFAAVKVFQFDPAMALGFFAVGCSPGGSASNAYTLLLDGDVSLSITMTLTSTIAALGMLPLWLLTLGRLLYCETSIKIPYGNIFASLVGLLVPVCIGLVIKAKRPRWARVLVTISKVVMVLFLFFVLSVGIYTKLYIFRLVTMAVLATSAIVPYLGFFLGGLVAFIFRMPRPQVLTVAIETGIQNTGIAIVLLLMSLPRPEADISIVAPITSAIFTPLPMWVGIAFVQGRKWWRKKHKPQAHMTGVHENGEDEEMREALQDEER